MAKPIRFQIRINSEACKFHEFMFSNVPVKLEELFALLSREFEKNIPLFEIEYLYGMEH